MTAVLPDPDPDTDPAGWVLLQCDLVEADVAEFDRLPGRAGPSPWLSIFIRAQVALWRGIAGRHQPMLFGQKVYCRGHTPAVLHAECPDLLTVVAAARAYQDGPGT